jgi:hypothetical protein
LEIAMRPTVLVLGAALAGAVLGHLGFYLFLQQGLYAIILPGALVGLAAGYFPNRALWVAVLCGLIALVAGILTEWWYSPFKKDESLGFFLAHLQDLKPITLLLIAVGGLVGFAGPFSRWRSAEVETKLARDIPVHRRETL